MSNFFPNNLIYLREKRGETQSETALALGLSRSTYVNYEVGENEPKLDTIMKIIGHFGIGFEEMTKSDLRNVHLNQNEGEKNSGKNVHLNVHPSVHPNPYKQPDEPEISMAAEVQQPYGKQEDYKAKYLALLETREAERANLAYVPERLLIVEARVLGLSHFLAKSLSPLIYTSEEAATGALSTFLNEEVKRSLQGNEG